MTTGVEQEAGSTPTGARRWWPKVRLLVSVALLAALLSRVDLGRALEVLARANVGLLALAVLVTGGGRFWAALRWRLLIRAMGGDAPFGRLVRLTFIGMFLQFMPAGSIALEVGRVYGLSRTTSDLAGSFASVVAERVFGLGALILIALLGLSFAPPGVPPVMGQLAWLGFALIIGAGFAVMSETLRGLLDRFLALVRVTPLRSRLEKVYARFDAMRARPGLLMLSVVAAILNTAFRIIPAYLVALAIGIEVSLLQLFVIVPILTFAAQVPISAAGFGVREVGWVALLGLTGVPASEAVVVPLLLVAVVFIVALPGAWFYARHGLDAAGGAEG